MTNALVTGANGFIGSHLVRALLERGYRVACLVRPTADLTSLAGLPVTLHLGDLRQPETLDAPLRDVDYVFHLGAQLMATSQRDFDEANTQGTVNLLRAAEQVAGPRLKRFLYVSSQAAVGPGESATPLDEDAPLRPVSWYGTSKQHAEQAVRAAAERLPVTIVRPSSVYGERERDLSQTFPLVERGLQPVLGGQDAALNMVYVGDLVQGIIAAAESDASLNQAYFLVHPQTLHPGEVVRTVGEAFGKPAGLTISVPLLALRLFAPVAELLAGLTRERPRITRDKVREVSQTFWVVTPAKARRDFGWQAQTDLAAGMRRTVDFYLARERELHRMPLERPLSLWLKYVAVASGLGILIEITSRMGRFYTFSPRWLVFPVIFGGFGLSLGTLGWLFRARSDTTQFVVGTLGAGTAEMLNELRLLPGARWDFAPGWPLGIRNGVLRALVLGTAGGGFLLILNAILRAHYQHRLRVG